MKKTKDDNRRSLQRMVRRLGVLLNVRLPKRACRRVRLYGTLCRVNGLLRAATLSNAQLFWWHRNSGRLLKLDAKWFHRAETSKQPNDPSSATRPTRAFDCNRDARAGFAAAHG